MSEKTGGINPAPTDFFVGEGIIPSHRMLPPRVYADIQEFAGDLQSDSDQAAIFRVQTSAGYD
jgi:hypothetical protein